MYQNGLKQEYEDLPTYTYKCEKCNDEFSKICKIADRKRPLSEPCPSCQAEGTVIQTILAAPSLNAEVGGSLKKAGSGWGEVLSKVKDAHKINNIRD